MEPNFELSSAPRVDTASLNSPNDGCTDTSVIRREADLQICSYNIYMPIQLYQRNLITFKKLQILVKINYFMACFLFKLALQKDLKLKLYYFSLHLPINSNMYTRAKYIFLGLMAPDIHLAARCQPQLFTLNRELQKPRLTINLSPYHRTLYCLCLPSNTQVPE